MTKSETSMLVAIIAATYPGYYKNFDEATVVNLTNAWFTLMKDYSFNDATKGLYRYLKSETTGFPPSPGQVIAKMPTRYDKMLSETLEMDMCKVLGDRGALDSWKRLETVGSPDNKAITQNPTTPSDNP